MKTTFAQRPRVYGCIPSPTTICANKCYAAMAGTVNPAVPCRTLKFITENFAVTLGMTQS